MTNDQKLALAGISVIRPVVRTAASVPVNPLPFVARTPDERVRLLADTIITLRDRTKSGRPMKNPETLTVRTVAVWPANANAKSQATKRVGLVQCRETGETFMLWSHVGKVNGTFAPIVYDLAPELLREAFARAASDRAAMPADLRAELGFVG